MLEPAASCGVCRPAAAAARPFLCHPFRPPAPHLPNSSHGVQVLFTVGKPCSSCERGALASRSFAPGETIARVPAGATIALGPGPLPEEALKLLSRRLTEPGLNQTFAAFLGSLPSLEDMLAPSSLAPEELAELQMPELVSEPTGPGACGSCLPACPPALCCGCGCCRMHGLLPPPPALLPPSPHRPAPRVQERLLLSQQREVAAAFSKAGRPPWLTLQRLHHMTALVRPPGHGAGAPLPHPLPADCAASCCQGRPVVGMHR